MVKRRSPRKSYRRSLKRYFRRGKDKAIPLAATAGLVAIPFAHGEYSIFNRIQNAAQGADTWDNVGKQAVLNLTGYSIWDNQLHLEYLLPTYMPAVIGGLISKFIGGGPLNLNKRIPKVIRKYIKI